MEKDLDTVELELNERIEKLFAADGFQEKLEELIAICHDTAVYKGWWSPGKTPGEQIALFHAEISEALEELRNPECSVNEIRFSESGKPEGYTVELDDAVIRMFDTCGKYSLPFVLGLYLKMKYNLTRPHRHGNKQL